MYLTLSIFCCVYTAICLPRRANKQNAQRPFRGHRTVRPHQISACFHYQTETAPPKDLPGESEGQLGDRGQSWRLPYRKFYGDYGGTPRPRRSASSRREGGERCGPLFAGFGRAVDERAATPPTRVDIGSSTGERSEELQVSTAVSISTAVVHGLVYAFPRVETLL